MIVGLTGGIACGKSTVSRMLEARGGKIVDADRIAREVVLPGRPALQKIVEAFGPEMLMEDGTLHRKRLGSVVFRDEAKRRQLEAITHPEITKEMARRIEELKRTAPEPLIIVDVPLLLEGSPGKREMYEEIVVVYVPRETQLKRLMERDGLSEEEANQRIDAQLPIEQKRAMADVVIDNSGTLEETERQVDAYVARKKGSN